MTIHFNADLRPVIKDRVGMLHWVMDPLVSGFIIGYDLSGNQVLICNFDVRFPEALPAEIVTDKNSGSLRNIPLNPGTKNIVARFSMQQSVPKYHTMCSVTVPGSSAEKWLIPIGLDKFSCECA